MQGLEMIMLLKSPSANRRGACLSGRQGCRRAHE